MALPAMAAGVLTHALLSRHGLLPAAPPNFASAWPALLNVLAVPWFEEFIYRGLVFGGMRRSLPAAPAMAASAALFALIHHPLAMVPAFIVGLCTAYAAERSKSLLARMLVHALYNATMLVLG